MPPTAPADRRARLVVLAVSALAALVILGPALRPGYLLTYDMVFVPHQPITAELFGLGTQTPRAVPSQLAVAILSALLAADWLQKLVLLGALVLGGSGAGLLAPLGLAGRVATTLAYLWSPYVGQRLGIGQWPMLVCFAALPWMVRACLDIRAARPGSWRRLFLWTALCCLAGAPGWVVAVLTVPAGVLARPFSDRRRTVVEVARVVGTFGVLALPWAVPVLTRPAGLPADKAAAALFAARADTALGTAGSLLLGGGGWNADTDPAGRGGVGYAVGALLLLAVAAYGVSRAPAVRLAALWLGGALALALAACSAIGPLRDALAGLPGGGLLRDAPRYLISWLLALSVAFGAGVDRLRGHPRIGPVAVLLVLLPVAVLPSLGWGIGARLHPVRFPADFARVRTILAHQHGAILVAPLSTYRAYAWNGERTALNPLPRMFAQRVVFSSDLTVRAGRRAVTVAGDDPLATEIQQRLRAGPPAAVLGAVGVRFVIVDATRPAFDTTGLTVRYRGPDLRLYEVPGACRADPAAGQLPPPGPVVAGDAIVGISVLGVAAWSLLCLLQSPLTVFRPGRRGK